MHNLKALGFSRQIQAVIRPPQLFYNHLHYDLCLPDRTCRTLSCDTMSYSHSTHDKSQLPWTTTTIALAAAAVIVNTNQTESVEEEIKTYQKLGLTEVSAILEEADTLFSQNQPDRLYEYLKAYVKVFSAEIHWRLARAACDKAKRCDPKSDDRKALMFEAFGYAERGLAMDQNCGACHRWKAVMLNYTGDYKSISEKIKHSYEVQQHFQRAIELNPKDATSMYCLGQWCYYFAEMSWYTKKAASIVFGRPPSSTYAEALHYFLLAESTDPNFYSMNHLMLGKVYMNLKDLSKAKEHFVKARDLPVKTPDDQQAHAEALDFLKQLN